MNHEALGQPSPELAGSGYFPRPHCSVKILGKDFRAVMDTRADVCVGGKELFDLCLKENVVIKEGSLEWRMETPLEC